MAAETAPARQKIVDLPLLDSGLRLDDFNGMTPRAELRSKLAHVDGFIQSSPNDGKAASEATEVWMARTRSAVYFVFICHDSHPELIRHHLARRENISNDDTVAVALDSFHDQRTAVFLKVNPAGVQADASYSENTGNDYSYDTVWDSDGRVTATGWMALIAVPFRSLRFHSDQRDWGVVFKRSLPRNSETSCWPWIAANVSGMLTQEAILRGMEGASGSHNLQLNPYTLGQNERSLNDKDPSNPFFSARRAEGTGGGEVKLILKDSVVVDGTINPDFSDVESDQPQFTVNQRYPVYFPELRPFFLENASYFNTPMTLVYTRNIVHPEFGVRVTGKMGRTNLGIFAIDDRSPGEMVAPGDPLYLKRATIGVGRVSEDLGKGSSVGLIYTDEEFGGGWNRIGGADFTWRFSDHWTAWGQWLESSTMGDQDSGTPIPYAAGPGTAFQLSRSGHAFNLWSESYDMSTGFETQLGYIQSADIRRNHSHVSYQWYPKHSRVQSFGLETDQNIAFDHQNNRVYHYSSFDPFWTFKNNFVIYPLFGQNSDTVGPNSYAALTSYKNFTENYGGGGFRGAPWTQFNFNMQVLRSGNVNYYPAGSAAPFLLKQEQAQVQFSVMPVRSMTIDNTYLLDRDHAASDGVFVYEVQTMRSKVNYQFTRSISARVIAEYDSTLANPNRTSLTRTKQVATQALLTWLPHPGTAVYIGYNNDMQNIARNLCYQLPNGGGCDPNNTDVPRGNAMLNDGKQIFVKASYLIRF
jgi:hypothetical protein